jgi:hypothetical protein
LQRQRELEAEARASWAQEQRKFMEELMNQQRALREQARDMRLCQHVHVFNKPLVRGDV